MREMYWRRRYDGPATSADPTKANRDYREVGIWYLAVGPAGVTPTPKPKTPNFRFWRVGGAKTCGKHVACAARVHRLGSPSDSVRPLFSPVKWIVACSCKCAS